MKKTIKHYQYILENLISGVAFHQIIRDKNNNFVDFIFLEVNKEFENITGLKREEIIGKKASEVLPYIKKRKLDWYSLYNDIDLKESKISFEYFSVSTNKWFKVNVFSINKGYFITEFQDVTELINSRKEILERETNFREFFDSPGILKAICKIVDKSAVFLEVNKEFTNYFNLSQEEIKGKTFSDLKIPKRIEKIWFDNFKKSEEFNKPISFEYINSKNRYRFAISHFLGKDNDGFSKYSLVLQDITERKKAEAELRLSEEKFSKAFSISHYAILFTKFEDGIILDVNEGFLKISGYEYNQVIGKSTLELDIWLDAADRTDFTRELTLKGRLVQKEYKFRIKSGDIIIGLTSAELIDINKIKCIITSVLDITERKKAEIALKESEERFRKIFDEAPIGMVLLDNNLNYVRVNKAFSKMVGYSSEELFNLSFKDLVDFEFVKMAEDNYKRLLNAEIFVYKATKKYIKKSNDYFWGDSTTSVIKGSNGNVINIIEMIEDVTDKKSIEQNLILAKERAEEMNRIKSNFLAQMSHELRTPMVGIIGFSDLLKENLREKHLIDFADKINKGSKRLLDTLNQLLDLSIIEAKKLKVKFKTFNIVKEINEVVSFYENLAKEKKLELKFESEFDTLMVYSDLAILRQILNNLINNSIKYTKEGYIRLCLKLEQKESKKYICITVEDTGIGIPPDKQDIIWDSFRQVSEGHGRTFEGVGLGLTITKNLVNSLDGEIHLKESIPDKGSTFEVLLPYFEKSLTSDFDYIYEENSKKNHNVIKNKFLLPDVLYVDDDREAVIVVSSFLKNISNIDTADNAVAGINQARIKRYDLILMDINFRTGMDGLQAIQEIRKIPWYENVPIVAVTAFAMDKDKKEFLEKGCTHYISKPFSREEFVNFIQDILESIRNN